MDIPIKQNPIYKTETLDFTGILQEGLREEVKQAIFLHIKYEKIATVKREADFHPKVFRIPDGEGHKDQFLRRC